ncbi:hypothetical protein [Azospirillum brasilense]|uniref:hypothetical protein n=1 Tax=Azospirillum brasilense TaxID=192 RepID=UPI0010C14A25|nr:hypothetical protein [Azospirillum brasilense]
MVGSRGKTVAGAPITIEKYYRNASDAMKMIRCDRDPGLLGSVTSAALAMHGADARRPAGMALGEAAPAVTTEASMVEAALSDPAVARRGRLAGENRPGAEAKWSYPGR